MYDYIVFNYLFILGTRPPISPLPQGLPPPEGMNPREGGQTTGTDRRTLTTAKAEERERAGARVKVRASLSYSRLLPGTTAPFGQSLSYLKSNGINLFRLATSKLCISPIP